MKIFIKDLSEGIQPEIYPVERRVMGNYHARCGLGENPYGIGIIPPRITYQYRIIVEQPLNGPDDNPFKGGNIEGFDFVLLVKESNLYRDYGDNTFVTDIYGDVTVSGALNAGSAVINLMNLNIHGNLTVNIGEGSIKLKNVNSSKLFAISSGISSTAITSIKNEDSISSAECAPEKEKYEKRNFWCLLKRIFNL